MGIDYLSKDGVMSQTQTMTLSEVEAEFGS